MTDEDLEIQKSLTKIEDALGYKFIQEEEDAIRVILRAQYMLGIKHSIATYKAADEKAQQRWART